MLKSPIANFTYQLGNMELSSRKEFEVSDAGMDYNLPLPPLMKRERTADIIFCCDASSFTEAREYKEIEYAAAYAKRKGLKFPPIDNPKIVTDYFMIFEDEDDKTVPTIVYFLNPVSVNLGELMLSNEKFDDLCDTMKKMVVESRSVLVDVIRRKMGA